MALYGSTRQIWWHDFLGAHLLTFDIGEIEEGEFFIHFKLRHKEDDFKFNLISVYGPAQLDQKPNFLSEMVRVCSKEALPIIIGGDFNIIRRPDEKNNDNYSDRWPFMFNAVIDALNLREIDLSGRKYTWANNLPNQTFEKLDRVLVCTDFESKYAHSTVYALSRKISDHTPLFFSTNNPSTTYQPQFKFELGWLLREGFCEMVSEIWQNTLASGTPIERWQMKIRRLRQHLRGWAMHLSGAYKKEKSTLLNKLDELDKKAESTMLNESERDLKHVLNERLAELLREEDLKWYQRAKVKQLLEGDANTKYYDLLANGRHRKTRIFQLEDGNNIITGVLSLRSILPVITKTYSVHLKIL